MADKKVPQPEDHLLREIDEEIRQEQYEKLWKKYGHWVIAGAVALVIAVAGYKGLESWTKTERDEASRQFYSAMKSLQVDETEAARIAFARMAETAPDGYALLAQFQEAAIAVRAGNAEEAAALYRDIAATAPDKLLADLALLLAAVQDVNRGVTQGIESKIGGLMADGNPWRHSAREIAAAAQLAAGDTQRAAEHLNAIADSTDAPSRLRNRAQELLQALED